GAPEFVIGSSTATHLVVTGAGNVGIGTTSPYGTLSVSADSSSVPAINFGTGAAATTYMNIAGGRAMIGYDSAANAGSGALAIGVGSASKSIDFYINGTNNSFLSGTKAMVINSSGNVGIGTTSPQYPLHVYSANQATAAHTDAGSKGDLF